MEGVAPLTVMRCMIGSYAMSTCGSAACGTGVWHAKARNMPLLCILSRTLPMYAALCQLKHCQLVPEWAWASVEVGSIGSVVLVW